MQKNKSINHTERMLKPALKHGWHGRCPNCGTGKMMSSYLQVHHNCPNCNEELHHHRADDGPAYVTILIAGHIIGPSMLLTFEIFRPEPLVMGIGFSILFVIFALYFLPRIKGVFVALQWAKRMHGFRIKK